MADALDFSDLGAEAPTPVAAASPSSPSGLDFSDLGSHPMAGPSGDLSVDVPRRLASAGTDALGMMLSTPRALAQGVDWLGNKAGVNIGADSALGSIQQPGGGDLFPGANAAREAAYKTTGATEYVPSTTAGRLVQAGLTAGAGGIAAGPAALLPSIVGGAGGEAAAELFPEHPIIARLLGFAFGAHTASAVANGVTKTAAMATGTAPTTNLYQAYERQGVPTTLSGDVTQNPTLQRLQSMAAKMPGGEDAIRKAGGEALDAWQTAAEKTAAQLGPSATLADAGAGLQTAARGWLQDFKQNSATKWDAFRQAVPPSTQIRVDGFQKALQSVNQDFGGADELAKALQPGLALKLKDALTADLSPGGTLSWQGAQATRSRLGEMLEGGQPIGDIAQSAIKRLYGGLSDDMRAGANAGGPAVGKAFNQANAYTAYGHALLEDHIAPILKATEPGQAAQYALAQMKLGGSRLNAIEHAMPGQPANLGAAVLRQAAENGPGGLPNVLKKISPEARPVLFNAPLAPSAVSPTGWPGGTQAWGITPPPAGVNPAMQGVTDLNDIAQAMRRTVQTTGNNSNTAAHSASGLGRIMSAIEMAKEGREIGGLPGALVGGSLGLFAPNIVGRGARMMAANPLLSKIYSTDTAPFNAPGMYNPNALLQLGAPDRRSLPGVGISGPSMNPLLYPPASTGNAAKSPKR